jgi:hypothetical protein
MTETPEDAQLPPRPALLLPQAIARVLMVCLGYALLLALVPTLSDGFVPYVLGAPIRGVLSVAAFVVSAGVGPWLLWRMGDRAPIRLVLGGLVGVAAGYAVAGSLRAAVLLTGGDPYLPTQAGPAGLTVLAASVLGVAGIVLALYLSRREGFDEKKMGVDGVLAQPERYSPVASASAVVSVVLGAAMLLIAIGVAVRLAGGPMTTSPVVARLANVAVLFASLGSEWLLIAGIVSLALVALHGFRRGPAPTDPVGS